MKLPNIVVRILAGAVFVAFLLGGILVDEYTFVGVFTLITGLALYEFYILIEKTAKVPISKTLNIVAGVFLFLGGYLYNFHSGLLGFVIYLLLLFIIFISQLYQKKEDPIKCLAYSIFGQVYIAGSLALLSYLARPFFEDTYQSIYILAIFVFIWVNDSFAYLTGMAFGKHRLFERISPKKSWEGFIGGAIFSIASSLLFYYFSVSSLNMYQWMGFAAVTVACGTWGDLFESLIKRTLGVKDSGNMIPGHGGILDRMDSTLLAIPAVAIYLCFLHFI